jgi:hypothetical protein
MLIREVRYFPSQGDRDPEIAAVYLLEWFVGLDELERRLRECSLTIMFFGLSTDEVVGCPGNEMYWIVDRAYRKCEVYVFSSN